MEPPISDETDNGEPENHSPDDWPRRENALQYFGRRKEVDLFNHFTFVLDENFSYHLTFLDWSDKKRWQLGKDRYGILLSFGYSYLSILCGSEDHLI